MKSSLDKKVIAVIPAYNEEENVGDLIKETSLYVDFTIVVDDGSTDRTCDVAKRAGGIVLQHSRNMGKGAALKTGIRRALELDADIIVTIDGDGQYSPMEIPKLVAKLEEGYDLVVGCRRLSGEMPLVRRLSNLISSAILRVLFRIPVKDTQCGLRAFTRSALEQVPIRESGYLVESQVLVDAVRSKLRVGEIPVTVSYSGVKSKIKPVRETLLFTLFILREILRALRLKLAQ